MIPARQDRVVIRSQKMDLQLSGKNALVCGGSKGIGRAIAARLVSEGASVVTVSRKTPPQPIAGATQILHDLSSSAGCEAAYAEALAVMGGIDLLLLNAGGPPAGPALEMTDQQWRNAFELTLMSSVRLSRLALPSMKTRGFGRIVAITSISALEPLPNLALSNALRPAVHGFLKTLANETVSTGVTVNAVAPGYTETERLKELIPAEKMTAFISALPMKRLIDPAEIAAAVLFLMAPAASSITGTVLPCDGGALKKL